MEANNNGDVFRPSSSPSSSPNSRRYSGILSASNIIQAPLSVLLEYSGLLPSRSAHHSNPGPDAVSDGEVSIRIIGATEQEQQQQREEQQAPPNGGGLVVGLSHSQNDAVLPSAASPRGDAEGAGDGAAGGDGVARDSSYQRYDIQHAARWIEQVLPFSLLLLVVFIRQHLQGREEDTGFDWDFCWVRASCGWSFWWYQNDDLMCPLIMLPPKDIPPFWHAIFIIMVNDTLVRQAAMVFKCILLMYYKNSRGRNYRKQGQMLTLVEYLLLLYRALLPTPVWYRFFLNKEYGSLFSSLMTGLYLTFKLTSVVEKVQSFFAAVKALSRKEMHYGAYATSEQVNAAGDLCAICQEKMHAPILLRCKHIFCEDCVSEWFERERTCPLCRALVKPADLRSFGDGSTSLYFQLF
ncbi:RING finger and transmembrane domain-containing protein 2 [Spatholobus suberectus]|nr:RING finger and transmembrane domain-containing protein 2 [Spatholobus suberectus]